MLPVIAIVGRPNVGKSTFFNYLTRSRNALVADEPGVTRDRQYGEARVDNCPPFIVIDTGGLEKESVEFQTLISQQTWAAVQEANLIFWMVDARTGLTSLEQEIAKQLRPLKKPIYLVINKSDGLSEAEACVDFYKLGIDKIYMISAVQGRGIGSLLQSALANFPLLEEATAEIESGIKIAIVGRPNVGKSTLVNRILGEERVLVFDAPGTTRDSIIIPFERRGKKYTLIDTAGVRRRRSVGEGIEKFSVVKTLQAVTESNVVVFVIDAQQSLADQDLHLLGFILDAGKSLVIAINKWDDLPMDKREAMQRELDRRLAFVRFAQLHFISALHGSGVGDLFPAIEKAYRCATRKISTHKATEALQRAIEAHQPPAVMGRRIKLRYAHLGGSNPMIFVVHGNQTDALPMSYRRYLENFFRVAFSLVGAPIKIELRNSDNPYKDKKNVLTQRQVKRRKRLIRHIKKL